MMIESKMVMTEKLANEIMDNLACLAISAMGTEGQIEGWEKDEGEDVPIFKEEYTRKVLTYAREKFVEICDEWEQEMGEAFQVIPNEKMG